MGVSIHMCVSLCMCVYAFFNNSFLLLQGLSDAALFAPLLGGHSIDERNRFSKAVVEKTKDDAISGFSLLGLHTNGVTTEKLDLKLLSNLVKVSLVSISMLLKRSGTFLYNGLYSFQVSYAASFGYF